MGCLVVQNFLGNRAAELLANGRALTPVESSHSSSDPERQSPPFID